MLKKIFLFTTVLFLAGTYAASGVLYADEPVNMKLAPGEVLISSGYNGTEISASGKIPQDADVVIKVTGLPEDLNLKKKGRAMGILWMNLSTLHFHHAPNIYMIYLSEDTSKLFESGSEEWKKMAVGFESLKKKIDIAPENEDTDAIFQEFLKLKQREGFYAMHENAVTYGKPEDGTKTYKAELSLPSALKPGTYQIEAMTFRRGDLLGTVSEDLTAKEIGLPSFISSLAFNHGTLYGTLSAVIAILAGLLTGVLFGGSKGAH